MDGYIGEIRAFAFNYAPDYWVPCNGQLLGISEFQALYAVLGNRYGGTYPNTFAVPDLRGYAIAGTDNTNQLGVKQGTESQGLSEATLPAHTHSYTPAYVTDTSIPPVTASSSTPSAGGYLYHLVANVTTSTKGTVVPMYVPPSVTPVALATQAIVQTGDSGNHENRQPLQAINYMICTIGAYPAPS